MQNLSEGLKYGGWLYVYAGKKEMITLALIGLATWAYRKYFRKAPVSQ